MHTTVKTQIQPVPERPGTFSLALLAAAGALFALISAAGICFPHTLYPTAELYQSFYPNDFVDLFFGIPVLILSIVTSRRKARRALIGVGGSLLFILYNGIAYLYALRNPFSLIANITLVLLCGVALCLFAADLLKTKMEAPSIRRPKVYGAILAAMGLIFVGRALSNLTGGNADLSIAELGVNVADLAVCLLWIASGLLLLVKKPNGGTMAAALICYLHGSLLFIALLLFMILQPLLSEAVFVAADLAVIAGMSLVMIVPCALLLRAYKAGGTTK